jgi:TetR/AcrR family transcriptional regulator, transcriptional repressor for nem operon
MGRVSDAKQRLLDATIDLIWQHSYGAVTVDNICERAGVKKGSFYYFFPSKTDLVVAALDAHWQTVRCNLDRVFSPELPAIDRLHQYFQLVYERQLAMKQKVGRVLGCPFCSVGSETSCSDAVICGKVQELMSSYEKYFEATITELQEAGIIKRQDVATQVQALSAYMHGVLGQARIQNDLEPIRNMEPGALKLLGVEPVIA